MTVLFLILAGCVLFLAFYGWFAWPDLMVQQARWKRGLKWLLFLLTCAGICLLALFTLFQMAQYPYDSIKGSEARSPSAAQYP